MAVAGRESVLRALRQRRVQVALGILALLVVVRIALPYALRSAIVSQADAALVGRVSLEDLDLSLIRGGVTLYGLGVHTDELPSAEPALFEAKRLWTQISWLALFTKTIEVEEFELEGFVVRLDRMKEGMMLPRPVPAEAPPEPAPEPAKAEPLGWSLAADDVAFRDGQIFFRDYTVGDEPQRFDLAVKDLAAKQIALRIDPTGQEPGRISIVAQIGEGSVGLDSQVTQHAAGPGAVSTLTLANLPIDKVRVYLKMFGWSDLSGKLDASIEHRFEPGGVHQIGGAVSLSDVAVRVPGLDRPALGFEKLRIALDAIDVVKQSAAVAEVALVGARVVVDARSKTPVPALAKPAGAQEPAAQEPAAEPPAEPAAPAKPWTWSVRKARLERALVELEGGDAPLPIGVDAEVGPLSGDPGSRWPLALRVAQGEGSLGVDGELAIDPLAFDGKLSIAELALAPLLSRIDAPAVGLLRQGRARAELSIGLAQDLRVAGTLGLAGLELGEAKTAKEFGVAWKDFELGIRELSVPGIIGASDPAPARVIGVKLDALRLVEPAFTVTRTSDGIVLPSFGSAAAEPAKPEAPAAPSAEPAKPATQVAVELADARIERARLRFGDRTVKPFFATRIDRLDLRARGIRWPGPRVESLTLALLGMNGAKLDARGSILPGGSTLDAKLVKLPLAQFNPYVTPTGYGLSDGALSFDTQAKIEKDAYRTSTDVVVSKLEMGGSEGESLFQQSFGIPLSVALGLLKDLDGNITLSVPVDGDRGGVKLGLGSIVGQALRSALMGALASPLKLLGAITADGKVQSLAPEPVGFVAGSTELAPDGGERMEQIAGLLSGSPGIALTLSGGTSESDLRVLRERALLAELQATSGVRALGQLGEIGTRRAVRNHLATKLAGAAPPALEPDQEAWLEEKVAAIAIDATALQTLAATRAAAVHGLLVREHGIAERQLSIGPPTTDPPLAKPGVAIALGTPKR